MHAAFGALGVHTGGAWELHLLDFSGSSLILLLTTAMMTRWDGGCIREEIDGLLEYARVDTSCQIMFHSITNRKVQFTVILAAFEWLLN